MKVTIFIITILLLSLVLSGCFPSFVSSNVREEVQELSVVTAYPNYDNSTHPSNGYPGPTKINPVDLISPPAPNPNAGSASFSGIIYSFTSQMVIPETQIYLSPVRDENEGQLPPFLVGPSVENGDISLITDAKGSFSANDIPPGRYFIAVWAPYNWIVVQSSPDNTNYLFLDFQADQKYEVGILNIAWP